MLSKPERGAASLASGTAVRRVASWRMSKDSSRSDLVIPPSLFIADTRLEMISNVQGWRQTKS